MEVSYTTFNDDMTEYKPQHHFQPFFYHLNKVSDCTPICDVWKKKERKKNGQRSDNFFVFNCGNLCVLCVREKKTVVVM